MYLYIHGRFCNTWKDVTKTLSPYEVCHTHSHISLHTFIYFVIDVTIVQHYIISVYYILLFIVHWSLVIKNHNISFSYYTYILSLLLYFIHPVKISLAKIKRIILYYKNVLRKKWRKNYLGRYIQFQYYYQCWDKILYKIWSTAI